MSGSAGTGMNEGIRPTVRSVLNLTTPFLIFVHLMDKRRVDSPHRIHLTLIIFLLVPLSSLRSQSVSVAFERLAIEQGLSHNAVMAVVQDKQGFLWFGTQDGLNRYDGLRFTVFRNNMRDSSSLFTSNIRNLFADREGNVWAGTHFYGLHRFDPVTGKFTRYRHDPANDRSLSSNSIECIYEDSRGAIWVGTANGLNRLDPVTGHCDRYHIPGNGSSSTARNVIVALHDDSRGRLWIGHGEGLATLEYTTGSIRQVLNTREVMRWITGDTTGRVWAGTESRMIRYNPEGGTMTQSGRPRELIYGMQYTTVMDNSGILWSNTERGLYRYDPLSNSSRLFPLESVGADLKHYPIRSVCVDRSGIVWIGTLNGIYKSFPAVKLFKSVRFASKQEGRIDRNNVRSFAEDRTGTIWIGTLDGFFRFDPRTQRATEYSRRQPALSTLAGTAFWSILVDSTRPHLTIIAGLNKLVFPPGRGLTRPSVGRIVPLLDSLKAHLAYTVEALLQDRTGVIWVGFSGSGLARYNPRDDTFKQFFPDPANPKRLNTGAVFALCETEDGSIWLGTNGGGLNRFDRKTEEFTRYVTDPKDANSLGDNGVLSLLPDESGILWVGTYAGLDRFDTQRGTFRRYTTEDGLANNVIYGILKDNSGNLWLSSNFGITRFNPATGLIKNYGMDDGIQDYEFNHNACFKASTGEMYFGGINGFNIFHPDSVKDNPHLPRVVLVDLKVLNKSVQPGPLETRMLTTPPMARELFLNYEDAALTFEFAALEFTDPSFNQYAYMLEGFDNEWQYVGTKREATYTNLDPGLYTLQVKASNKDGVWGDETLALLIHVAPPWWMTWWFRGAIALFFLSIGPIVYLRRVAVLKRDIDMQQEFSRRLIESQEQERRRIASELHDSIGQDLLVIKNRTTMALQVPRLNLKAQEQLNHITRTVTEALRNVRQIARNLRPYHLDRVGLTGALRSTLETVAESSAIAFDLQIEPVDHLYPPDKKEMEVNIFRVVQESVNNILKHSEAHHARIAIRRSDHQVTIQIEDDGKGFDVAHVHAAHSKAGLGISGIGERIKMLGGTYSLESSPGSGTKVLIAIPIGQQGGKS